ncbi:hypothetical protein CCMA1212_001011 [Trichoderma ghanense]|uniref:Uncharacterized protein n=1 Tax=Trichoderma ghanense TaxID=65468 RepID=A0ABY2HFN3_9HYPO
MDSRERVCRLNAWSDQRYGSSCGWLTVIGPQLIRPGWFHSIDPKIRSRDMNSSAEMMAARRTRSC